MTPVKQTITTLQDGNCFAACVASLMDLPLDAVPNFAVAGEDWWFRSFVAWVASRGLQAFGARLPEEADRVPCPGFPVILGVPSTLHPGALHAVIGVKTPDGWEILHDPHPAAPFPHKEPVDAQWIGRIHNGQSPYAWSARELDENGEPVWGPMEDLRVREFPR